MTAEERQAIRGTGGNKAAIAKKLGIDREDVNARIDSDEGFRECVADERDRIVDMCEASLIKAAQGGDQRAAARLIVALAKVKPAPEARGYIHIFREMVAERRRLLYGDNDNK